MDSSHASTKGLAEFHGPPLQLPVYNMWELLTSSGDKYLHNRALIALHHPSTHLSYLFPQTSSAHDDSTEHQTNGKTPGHVKDQYKDFFSCTHAELRAAAERVAHVLFSNGIRKGDCITIFTWNCAEWAVLYWASAWLGTIFAPLDPEILHRADDLAYHLDLLKPKVLVAELEEDIVFALKSKDVGELVNAIPVKCYLRSAFKSGLQGSEATMSFETLITSSPKEHSAGSRDQLRSRQLPTAKDPILILFTSGTTSRPKGCVWTAEGWTAVSLHFTNYASIKHNDTYVMHTACFRGISVAWDTPTWSAGATVIMPSAKFTSKTTLAAIELGRATVLTCVPHQIHVMSADPDLELYDRHSVKMALIGGDLTFSRVIEETKRTLCADWVVPLFGQTEGIGYINWQRSDEIPMLPSGVLAVGRVASGASIRICEPGTRKVVALGEAGVLHVSNASTITRYIPERDLDQFYSENGQKWFVTGDQSMIDESGALFVTGRYKDTIKVADVNYSPAVIEGSLQKTEGVTAHVVGIPHDLYGSVPAAVVVSKARQLTEELKQQMRDRVAQDVGADAHFHEILTLEELRLQDYPLNDSGKVMKRELAVIIAEHNKSKTG